MSRILPFSAMRLIQYRNSDGNHCRHLVAISFSILRPEARRSASRYESRHKQRIGKLCVGTKNSQPPNSRSSLLPLITHTPRIPPSTLSTLRYLKTQILQLHKSIRESFFIMVRSVASRQSLRSTHVYLFSQSYGWWVISFDSLDPSSNFFAASTECSLLLYTMPVQPPRGQWNQHKQRGRFRQFKLWFLSFCLYYYRLFWEMFHQSWFLSHLERELNLCNRRAFLTKCC